LESPVVLVIEVESILRMETGQMVKDAGYTVFDAPSTDNAMTILEGRLYGAQLAAALRALVVPHLMVVH
jgi:hypothetical protein